MTLEIPAEFGGNPTRDELAEYITSNDIALQRNIYAREREAPCRARLGTGRLAVVWSEKHGRTLIGGD